MKKNINDYVKMLIHSTKTQCIVEALELKLFDAIDGKTKTEKIANDLNVDEKKLKILLDALVFLDLLYFENGFFTLTKTAKVYFFTKSSQYAGDMFLQRHVMIQKGNKFLDKFLQKTQLQNDKPQINKAGAEKLWAAAAKSLKGEQILRKPFVMDLFLQIKNFPTNGKILDLGCSAGLTLMDITNYFPNLELVLFDYPPVIEVAKEIIKEYGVSKNVSTISGDINKDNFGKGYEVIWCSHVIYFLENKKNILEQIYNALSPNGIFISYHTEVDEKEQKYKDNFFSFLHLALQNRQIIKPLELVQNLEEVGFKSIISFENPHDLAVASQVIIARKVDR